MTPSVRALPYPKTRCSCEPSVRFARRGGGGIKSHPRSLGYVNKVWDTSSRYITWLADIWPWKTMFRKPGVDKTFLRIEESVTDCSFVSRRKSRNRNHRPEKNVTNIVHMHTPKKKTQRCRCCDLAGTYSVPPCRKSRCVARVARVRDHVNSRTHIQPHTRDVVRQDIYFRCGRSGILYLKEVRFFFEAKALNRARSSGPAPSQRTNSDRETNLCANRRT